MNNATRSGHRRCFECGEKLRLERGTVDYPESGLDNVRLVNVPIWRCANQHDEVEIPAVEELQNLLAETVIRKGVPLVGAEVRFLRKRLELTARQFSERLGMTAVHLSRLENGRRPLKRQADLLIRLFCAVALARKRQEACRPEVVLPLLDELEASAGVNPELRFRHRRTSHRGANRHEWVEAGA